MGFRLSPCGKWRHVINLRLQVSCLHLVVSPRAGAKVCVANFGKWRAWGLKPISIASRFYCADFYRKPLTCSLAYRNKFAFFQPCPSS